MLVITTLLAVDNWQNEKTEHTARLRAEERARTAEANLRRARREAGSARDDARRCEVEVQRTLHCKPGGRP